jgi:2-polyprenyl-3-methyl-5-hydroxy-6-metoxy-1,4-benzoquinol methylase
MGPQKHWDDIYAGRSPEVFSWFRPHLETSISLIERAAPHRSACIIDVGGGESTLVDDLLAKGYQNIDVLDISQNALEVTKTRLGDASKAVGWLCADIRTVTLPRHSFDVWHDRAVFHFLTDARDRVDYVKQVEKTVKPGGHVIVSTFGTAGPEKCSGLEVVRYSSSSLHNEFGRRFQLVESSSELHHTPTGTTQQFIYCWCVVE